MNLLISAYNVRSGGGVVLLKMLLEALPNNYHVTLLCDENFKLGNNHSFQCIRVRKTLWARLKVEWMIYKLAKKNDKILCFGNLPPLFSVGSKAIIFLQNKYIIQREFINTATKTSIVRSFIERFWFFAFSKKKYRYIVQTESMKKELDSFFGHSHKVEVIPFFNDKSFASFKSHNRKNYYVYIASPDLHKNHLNLVRAWAKLKEWNLFPELILIFGDSPKNNILKDVILFIKNHHLNVKIETSCTREKCLKILAESKALVFPSTLESFGLPLLEAASLEIPIIASELDYVRDIVIPVETFDPRSELSIARAILRFQKRGHLPITIHSSESFLKGLKD